MLIFNSFDALAAHKRPTGQVCDCGAYDWMFEHKFVHPLDESKPDDLGVHVGFWRCPKCDKETQRCMYIHRRETLWTPLQVTRFREVRQQRDMSLKDVAAATSIPVSRLSDFERMRAGPTPAEQRQLSAVLHPLFE